MVVIYTVPSSKYKLPPPYGMPLDEIEIQGPAANQTTNTVTNAQFTLLVKTTPLTKVVASITLTRFQSIPGGAAANLGPAAGAGTSWTFTLFPTATPPYEGIWTMDPAVSLAVNANPTFTLQFNTGAQAGIYRLTYRVQSDELKDPVETTFDMVVA